MIFPEAKMERYAKILGFGSEVFVDLCFFHEIRLLLFFDSLCPSFEEMYQLLPIICQNFGVGWQTFKNFFKVGSQSDLTLFHQKA